MNNIHFYPRLTPQLIENSGFNNNSSYVFSYRIPSDHQETHLELKTGRTATLSDPLSMWSLKEDGLILSRTVVIEYPSVLKGPEGIAPSGATVLPCILWSNKKLSLAGVIRPKVIADNPSLLCKFDHYFEPRALAGDLTLELVLYLANPAGSLVTGEEHLMNEAGVTLGNLENPLVIDIEGDVMDFPIEEFSDEGGPLWRMQFDPWEDPRTALFSEESFSLLLNTKHPDCPKIARGVVSNLPLLKEIVAQAYFLLFEKVREVGDGAWDDMRTNTDLVPDSICSVLHWFSQKSADVPFNWTTPEDRLLSIKQIVDLCFEADEND